MCAFIKIRVTKIFFPVTKSKKDRQIYYQIYKCPLCYIDIIITFCVTGDYLQVIIICLCHKFYVTLMTNFHPHEGHT